MTFDEDLKEMEKTEPCMCLGEEHFGWREEKEVSLRSEGCNALLRSPFSAETAGSLGR